MKKYTLILATIFILFGSCSTHRKLIKSASETLVKNDIQTNETSNLIKSEVKKGVTTIKENNVIEETTIKNTQPQLIELTANFKIDSNATLRCDTALKLVDVSDKNISVTIYQNGKTGQLKALIKSKNKQQDLPFSEISIKKSALSKESNIDTTKFLDINLTTNKTNNDQSKSDTKVDNSEKDVKKVNYSIIVIIVAVVGGLIYWLNRK